MARKHMSLISVLLIAGFVLSACTTEATETPPQPPVAEPTKAPSAEPTEVPEPTTAHVTTLAGTVTLWQSWEGSEITSLNEVIASFKAKYPDVTVDVLYIPFPDLRGKFETTASKGGAPTVLIGAADWGPGLFDAGLVADLTGQVSQEILDTITPSALGAAQYKGALIGLPQTVYGVVLFRNKAIQAEPASNVDDFIEKAIAASTGGVKGADFEYGFFYSAPILHAQGGSLMMENGDPAFNDESGVAWITTLRKIKDAGIPVENYNDNDLNLFKSGKVGWIIDGTWNASSLAESIGVENLAIDPWPAGLSGYTQTENIYLNLNAVGDDAAAGLAFIEFFLSPEAQAILADPGTEDAPKAGHLPAITGVEISNPLLMQASEALANGTAFPVIPEMNAYWDPMNNALKAALVDGTDPAAALQAAFDAITANIADLRANFVIQTSK